MKQKSKYEGTHGRRASSHRLITLATGVSMFVLTLPMLWAQSTSFPVGLPARAPGYDHYYQIERASTVFATRWGYFDGYQDGKRDRELGNDVAPTDHDRYKVVPDHGYHPEISREKYKVFYRQAYLHGYDYGSKF